MSGFEIAGLIGTIQAVLHLSNRCLTLAQKTADASDNVARVVGAFGRVSFALELYLEALNKVLHAPSNNDVASKRRESLENLLSSQEAALDALRKQLQLSIDRAEDALQKNVLKRMIWVVRWQNDLESQVQELESWAGHFHLIYASIGAVGGTGDIRGSPEGCRRVLQVFDAAKRTPLDFAPKTVLTEHVRVVREDFGIGVARLEENNFVVEFIHYSDTLSDREVELVIRGALDVAKSLCQSDPLQTHLLQYYGHFHDKSASRFGLLFSIPPGYRPVVDSVGSTAITLHSVWNSKPPQHSLEQRFRFAREIATGLLYVHAAGWVLKGLSPFSIVLLERIPAPGEISSKTGNLPHAFLVGIQEARTDNDDSQLRVSSDWRLNIYRHPRRQTGQEVGRFRMAYDVYSLGVVLLELGLWSLPHFRRFVSLPEEFKSPSSTGLSVAEKLVGFIQGSTPENRLKGRGIHCSMGRRYLEVVQFCLNRGDNGRDQVETVEKVWQVLDDISNTL